MTAWSVLREGVDKGSLPNGTPLARAAEGV
jgi:hypothetical protein